MSLRRMERTARGGKLHVPLKGWAAVPALLFVLAFAGYRLAASKSTLAEEATAKLRLQLKGEYAARHLEGVDPRTLSRDRMDPRVAKLQALERIDLVSISSRGRDPTYVRVEIRVDGKEPPDGRPVRYWCMEYSVITGWRVVREISSWKYYLRLF